jgi:hypothetical protein
MPRDIRDKPFIGHDEIMNLNFVNHRAPYLFRKHFRQGLRSHIMEILDPKDVQAEQKGVVNNGLRWFPRARPRRMFRIFRSRLQTLDKALGEIARVKIVERYLAPDCMATSVECIVAYAGPAGPDLILCGFQEYVPGVVLDPWSILDSAGLIASLYDQTESSDDAPILPKNRWIDVVREKGMQFVARIKQMVFEDGHIPDLAGAGNLIVTPTGEVRLVDINNISPIAFDESIFLDEKGYPVCDKSVEALSLMQEKVARRPVDRQDKLFRHFLDPLRWKDVKAIEEKFWKNRSGI